MRLSPAVPRSTYRSYRTLNAEQVAVDSVERVADVLAAIHALVARRREKASGAKLLRQLCRPEMRVEVRLRYASVIYSGIGKNRLQAATDCSDWLTGTPYRKCSEALNRRLHS